jgi:hypothetical protein
LREVHAIPADQLFSGKQRTILQRHRIQLNDVVIFRNPILIRLLQCRLGSIETRAQQSVGLSFQLSRKHPAISEAYQIVPADAAKVRAQLDARHAVIVVANPSFQRVAAKGLAATQMIHNRRLFVTHIFGSGMPKRRLALAGAGAKHGV